MRHTNTIDFLFIFRVDLHIASSREILLISLKYLSFLFCTVILKRLKKPSETREVEQQINAASLTAQAGNRLVVALEPKGAPIYFLVDR